MFENPSKRKHLEEKQAFHNAIISIPFFISNIPTKIIAIKREIIKAEQQIFQEKVYYNGNRFNKTKIISFQSVEEARNYYEQFQEAAKGQERKDWIEYCKDISKMENILYQYGKMYVPLLENRELREFLNDVSQLVVFHGLFMEQHIKRTNNALFRFLDHKVLSLEHIYYRWRAYTYLQNDGQKKYRTQSFRILMNGMQWYPPLPNSLQRGILTYKQRKHFSHLLFKLTRKKHDIQQAMVFAISCMNCAVEVASIIILEIFQKLNDDFLKYFHLISDILFNTTTQDYRRLFTRVIPFILFEFVKERRNGGNKDKDAKYRSELKSLIQLWELKFIFDENYTKGLLFLLHSFEGNANQSASHLHERLKVIGSLHDDEESEYELEKLCFENGIPFLENEKEESTRLINEYLWVHSKAEQKVPQINQNVDGEPITEKDLIKIKSKQVKVTTCQNMSINILLERNWQTKGRVSQSNSIDNE